MKDRTYWTIKLIVFFAFIGGIIEFFKSYRSFFKILAVGTVLLFLGRLIIWNWAIIPENQNIVWFWCFFVSFLYLGGRIAKTKKPEAIIILRASSLLIAGVLLIFYFCSFAGIYETMSQTMLGWPTIFGALILVGAVAIDFGSPGWQKEMLNQETDDPPEKKVWSLFNMFLVILLFFLLGISLLVFSSFLKSELVYAIKALQLVGGIICLFSPITLFIFAMFFVFLNEASKIDGSNEKDDEKRRQEEIDILINLSSTSNPY